MKKPKKKPASSSSSTSTNDRLSNLPEDVLHHILNLSFLDMKQVVQTSILSKRWRYLWTSVPSLSFNSYIFLKSGSKNYPYENFDAFVTQVLRRRGSSKIHTLSVFSDEPCSAFHIKEWVCVAVRCNVQQLHLQFDSPVFCRLDFPPPLFSCKTLTSLKLELNMRPKGCRVEVPLPDSIDLPLLTALHLQSICMLNTDFLDKFFSGCPVLERLDLLRCEFDKSRSGLRIYSSHLKHLGIYNCMAEKYDSYNFRIRVSAPKLTSFRCIDWIFNAYYLNELSSLETVSLDLDGAYKYEDVKEKDAKRLIRCFQGLYNLKSRLIRCFQGLYNVKSLTLDSSVLREVAKALDVFGMTPISFVNLRYLKIETQIDEAYLQAIKFILENSSNIETVVVRIIWTKEDRTNTADYWGEEFLLQHLKYIEVRSVNGFANELNFLKILLRNAVTLEKMTIFASQYSSTNYQRRLKIFSDELLVCPKASSNVKVSFSVCYSDF